MQVPLSRLALEGPQQQPPGSRNQASQGPKRAPETHSIWRRRVSFLIQGVQVRYSDWNRDLGPASSTSLSLTCVAFGGAYKATARRAGEFNGHGRGPCQTNRTGRKLGQQQYYAMTNQYYAMTAYLFPRPARYGQFIPPSPPRHLEYLPFLGWEGYLVADPRGQAGFADHHSWQALKEISGERTASNWIHPDPLKPSIERRRRAVPPKDLPCRQLQQSRTVRSGDRGSHCHGEKVGNWRPVPETFACPS
jgi:hypothetical protein